MGRIRRDIRSGGRWNDHILWYAKAVGAMRERPVADTTSWVFYAGVHGFDEQKYIGAGVIKPHEYDPSNPIYKAFEQCQHGGWYFPPWHRGYLWGIESVLGAWISDNGGPDDWGMPYWNYLDDTADALDVPTEFRDEKLPDGSDNPLANANRGPATSAKAIYEDGREIIGDLNLKAQTNQTVYTSPPGAIAYGGPETDFLHGSGNFGALESNPHNLVHLMMGYRPSHEFGWMWDPDTAALDPIFWAHHCNIDRLWAAWMTFPGVQMESDAKFLKGPARRGFTVPNPKGDLVGFIPEQFLPGGDLEPQYDDLSHGTGTGMGKGPGDVAAVASASRPQGPGSAGEMDTSSDAAMMAPMATQSATPMSELLAAHPVQSSIGTDGVVAHLDVPQVEGIAMAKADAPPPRIYVNAEGIRGEAASITLRMSVFADDDADNPLAEAVVPIFGLAMSSRDGAHGQNGANATIEVTDELRAAGYDTVSDLRKLRVHVSLPKDFGSEVTIDKVSLYAANI